MKDHEAQAPRDALAFDDAAQAIHFKSPRYDDLTQQQGAHSGSRGQRNVLSKFVATAEGIPCLASAEQIYPLLDHTRSRITLILKSAHVADALSTN
ncbi:hypothetical protein MGN01_13930 [Methylobacterium gnaphalii]|uniref:Uncharacterized protein n=1 Tax=Methylobacterium gnaphalii TaxID=1010610 RepID=A0A512JHW2_9HYPH|nr:hypothetical protein MGN01_13930 [Methylobacterium gnaphalii]GLS48154.1 hypothetical protein GCM10007885_09980 [Methylobacterium gnaphalii]